MGCKLRKSQSQAAEMVYHIKVLPDNSDNMSSVSKPHVVEREIRLVLYSSCPMIST